MQNPVANAFLCSWYATTDSILQILHRDFELAVLRANWGGRRRSGEKDGSRRVPWDGWRCRDYECTRSDDIASILGVDARFPNTNQTKHCWQNYVDYHKCILAKGEDFAPCRQVRAPAARTL